MTHLRTPFVQQAGARRWRVIAAALVLFVFAAASRGAEPQHAAIASAHPLATAAGYAILERGGNAFDAAVAVAAALGVVEPYSSGLGGGGFFLLHRASDAHEVMIDARETAPAGANTSQYLDANGRPIAGATVRGGTAAGIPGLPAGLAHVAARYGKLPLAVSLEPAIALARDGFPVDARYARIAKLRESGLREGLNTGVYLDRGHAPEPGFVVRQKDLAVTLEKLAHEGAAGFYTGSVARALVATVNRAGGQWTLADLKDYRTVERAPLQFGYAGARITAAALPSAGGIALVQVLGMLERLSVGEPGAPANDHLVVEALRRAFRDRSRFLADSDFVAVPLARLLSSDRIARQADTIDRARATPSIALGQPPGPHRESADTTHLSIVDQDGNRVAATLTINLLFGSRIVADGTGVLLNNEMDDFTLAPDVPNAFELSGGTANRIEPGKRPLSSMTPLFVEDRKGVLVVGAPGGSRIISQVLLATLAYLRSSDVELSRIVAMPRYHHQYWPDRVEVEPQGFSPEWLADMTARGHTIRRVARAWGNMQAVFKSRRDGSTQAASDPRGQGIAWY